MSAKFFFFICATFLIIQNTSAEDNINREQLTEHVTELYIQMIDQMIASFQNRYEPIINETENNKDTIDRDYALKGTELKALFQRANVKAPSSTKTTLDDLKHNKNNLFTEITFKVMEMEDYVKDKPKLGEQNVKLTMARHDLGRDAQQSIETYVNQTLEEVEKYWNGLTALEQKEKQKLRDTVDEVKVARTKSRKLSLLNKIFIFRDDLKQEPIKW